MLLLLAVFNYKRINSDYLFCGNTQTETMWVNEERKNKNKKTGKWEDVQTQNHAMQDKTQTSRQMIFTDGLETKLMVLIHVDLLLTHASVESQHSKKPTHYLQYW